ATAEGKAGEVPVRRTGANWRTLVSLPPAPPALTREQLVEAAGEETGTGVGTAPARRKPACVGCPVFMVDGMIPGGGGGAYSSSAPSQPAAAKPFDLAEVYTINGWFGDRYRDLLADSTDT